MAISNRNLKKAQKEKNDEYYTQYETIADELKHYYEYDKNVFRDKVILCPCDDPERSEFVNYFRNNFEMFGLKKVIFTSYIKQDEYGVIDLLNGAKPKLNRGKLLILDRSNIKHNVKWLCLEGDGDFRSDEIKPFLEEADMVITNPPFSLFREFIKWIMEAGKNFLILGNVNAVIHKEIFTLIKDNKIWFGCSPFCMNFIQPNSKELKTINTCWFTNIKHNKQQNHICLPTSQVKEITKNNKRFQEFGFKKYDYYNAIEIPDCRYIPKDYNGAMGVPITFLEKYNPEQFELLDCLNRYSVVDGINPDTKGKYMNQIDGKQLFSRVIIKHRNKS